MINYTDYKKLIEEKFHDKKYKEIIELSNFAIENDIENADFYYKYMAHAEFYLGNYDKALENYKVLLDLNDSQYDIYLNIGLIYLYFEEINNVTSNFHKVIKKNPIYNDFYKEKISSYESPNSEICAEEYKELLKIYPNQPLVLANLALITDNIEYIDKAINLEPDNYIWYTIKFYVSYPHYDWYNGLPNMTKSLELNSNQPLLEIRSIRLHKEYFDDILYYEPNALYEINRLKFMVYDFEKKYPNYSLAKKELKYLKKDIEMTEKNFIQK